MTASQVVERFDPLENTLASVSLKLCDRTRLLCASMMAARHSHPCAVGTQVMPVRQTWSSA